MLNENISLQTAEKYIHNLIAMMEALEEPWGLKDLESRHLYMNSAARIYTNTPENFDVEGRLDSEFPAAWSELAEELQQHDRLAERHRRRVSVIETHFWNGNKILKPYVSEKIPIFDENKKCIGTLWNAREMNSLSPVEYINRQKPAPLKTESDTDLFTRAELGIVFLALQRFSSKEIARRFNLSPKTVENRLAVMYEKTGTHSLRQFREFCRNKGLDHYIPPELVIKGIHFI